MSSLEKNFQQNLVKLLKLKKTSSLKIAQKAGILPQNFSKYVNGQLTPGLSTLEKISKALDVSVFELLSNQGHSVHFYQDELLNSIQQVIKNFVVFNNLNNKQSQQLLQLVENFGGWNKLLDFLKEDAELKQVNEIKYQNFKAEISQHFPNASK